MGWDRSRQQALCENLKQGCLDAELAPADRAMLEYALKLTRTPQQVERADINRLREHGFDDASIHDICCIAAYYAFVNRIADGLGVALEPAFQT